MSAAVTLRSLLGQAAPPELAAELGALLGLPDRVRATWAEVVEANLAPVLDDRVETFMKRYSRAHDVELSRLAAPAKACRFLFQQASKAGIGKEAFAADVADLLEQPLAGRALEVLLPIFDAAMPKLRQAAVFLSVAEHGRLVRNVRWRLEVIRSSDHGVNLDVPVATLTFQYQEGPTAGQTTFQLLPEQAMELRRALDSILG